MFHVNVSNFTSGLPRYLKGRRWGLASGCIDSIGIVIGIGIVIVIAIGATLIVIVIVTTTTTTPLIFAFAFLVLFMFMPVRQSLIGLKDKVSILPVIIAIAFQQTSFQ